jgi:hypothetical protein
MYGFEKYKDLYNVLFFPKNFRIRTLQTGSDWVQGKLQLQQQIPVHLILMQGVSKDSIFAEGSK